MRVAANHFNGTEKSSQMVFRTVDELTGQLFNVIVADFDRTFRAYLVGTDVIRTEGYFRVQTGAAHPIANLAILRDPDDAEMLSEAVEPLCSDEFPSSVALLGPVGIEVDQLLVSCGFQLVEEMPAMAVDLADLQLTLPGDDFRIRRVGADEHELWVDTMAEGYELPRGFVERIGPSVVDSIVEEGEEYRYFIAFHRDLAVATAVNIIRDGVVSVYNIATVPGFRGQGVGGFVTGEPLRIAGTEGYRIAILQASQMGSPVYRRLGFQSYGEIPLYVRMPAS